MAIPDTLSFEALGVITWARRTPNIPLTAGRLIERGCRPHTARRILRELTDAGLIVMHRERNPRGQLGATIYELVYAHVEETSVAEEISHVEELSHMEDFYHVEPEPQQVGNARVPVDASGASRVGASLQDLKPNTGLVVQDQNLQDIESSQRKKQKQETTFVPDGTVQTARSDAQADRDALLEATRQALSLGEAPWKLVAKYAGFLTSSLGEKDSRGRPNGDWYDYQLERGMNTLEITAFGLWLADTYDGEPMSRAETITRHVGQFRADEDHALYLTRARYAGQGPPRASPEDDEPEIAAGARDRSADMQAVFAELIAKKRANDVLRT